MYDTIVLGNDLGSLVAAVTLANQGRKTLLVADDTPHCYSESGYTFDIDPLPWSGFTRGNVFKQFLSHLGIPQEAPPLNPPLQIIFRRHRLELCGTTERDTKEIQREFPDKYPEMLNFYTSLAKSSSFASSLIEKGLHLRPETMKDYFRLFLNTPFVALRKRPFASHIKMIRQMPSLGTMLDIQLLLLSHLDPRDINPISLARALTVALQGVSYYREGKHLLIARLKKKFEGDGGDIEEHPVSTLDMERVIKINVESNDTVPTIYGRNIVISTYYDQFIPLLERSRELTSLRKRYGRIRRTLHPFTLHLGIYGRCIPEQMGTYVAVVPDETKTLEDGNLLFLETSEPGNTSRAPEGKRTLSITTFLKNPPSESADDLLKKTAEDMVKSLRFFLPFLEENIDFINLEKSIDISKNYRTIVGPRYDVKNSLLGISLLSNKTSMKNVFLTGDILLPGLGFEGEIISGMNAARLATGRD
jgi:phytoene dehydrogenase-like protein